MCHEDSPAQTVTAAQAAAVPNKAAINPVRTAVMFIDCIAATPCGAGRRRSAGMTKVEKA